MSELFNFEYNNKIKPEKIESSDEAQFYHSQQKKAQTQKGKQNKAQSKNKNFNQIKEKKRIWNVTY